MQIKITRTPEGEPLAALALWEAYDAAVCGPRARDIPTRLLNQYVTTAASWEKHAADSEEPLARVPFAYTAQGTMTGLYIRGPWGRWYRRVVYLHLVATEAFDLLGWEIGQEFFSLAHGEARAAPHTPLPWRWVAGRRLRRDVLASNLRRLPSTLHLPPMRTGLTLS